MARTKGAAKEELRVGGEDQAPSTYIFELTAGKCHTTNSFGEKVTYEQGDRRTGTYDQFAHDRRWKQVGPGSVPEKRANAKAANQPVMQKTSGVREAKGPSFVHVLKTGKCHTTDEQGKKIVLLPGAEKVGPKDLFKNDPRWVIDRPVASAAKTLKTKFKLTMKEREDGLFDVFKEGESKPMNPTPLSHEEAYGLVSPEL